MLTVCSPPPPSRYVTVAPKNTRSDPGLGIDHLGDLQALDEEANAALDLAQPLLPVE